MSHAAEEEEPIFLILRIKTASFFNSEKTSAAYFSNFEKKRNQFSNFDSFDSIPRHDGVIDDVIFEDDEEEDRGGWGNKLVRRLTMLQKEK